MKNKRKLSSMEAYGGEVGVQVGLYSWRNGIAIYREGESWGRKRLEMGVESGTQLWTARMCAPII